MRLPSARIRFREPELRQHRKPGRLQDQPRAERTRRVELVEQHDAVAVARQKQRGESPAGPAPAMPIDNPCTAGRRPSPSPLITKMRGVAAVAGAVYPTETSLLYGSPRKCVPEFRRHDTRPVAAGASAERGLTKRFDRPAVDRLDLTVRAGEFYALLGPNGAGKTTTLRMVAGLLKPEAGAISIFGIDALRRSGGRQADHGLGLGRADDLRQADAVRISGIRRRPVGHRRPPWPTPAPRICSAGSA